MSTKKVTLKADTRNQFGRKLKRLRKEGIIPANIFGKKITSKAIKIDQKIFSQLFGEVGETGLIDLQIDSGKESHTVLISNVQLDPVLDTYLHVDFRQVDLSQKLTANVPLEIVGESEAVKSHGATLVTNVDEIEVEALPTDLPESIQVDISQLMEPGDTITVSDLTITGDIEIQMDPDTVIAGAQEAKVVEETEEPETLETETDQASEDSQSETSNEDKESQEKSE